MDRYSENNKTTRVILACIGLVAVIAHPTPSFSDELAAVTPLPDEAVKVPAKSLVVTQPSAPPFKVHVSNKNQALGTWNRTPSRPAGTWTPAQADSRNRTNIRFASASGMDEGDSPAVKAATSQKASDIADGSLAAAVDTNTLKDASSTSPESVKAQLLNALRKQREAITNPVTLKQTTPPGSLTIMNSPKVTPKPAIPPAPASSPQEALMPTNQGNSATETDISGMMQGTSKSYAGLTRTLEEDLKSDDAYLRERAQRFLRLQMQLLQLRSRQVAAAETAIPNTTNNASNLIPVNPGNTAATIQPTDPYTDSTPGSTDVDSNQTNPEPQPSDDSMVAGNSNSTNLLNEEQARVDIENENISGESNQSESEHTTNASLLKTVVVDGPIDRLGLANNLLALGEYPLALEMYQMTSGQELSTQQQFWVEYQTANCLRRLGNPAEASNRYRKLASQPEAGWLSKQAHWWVEILESIRILEKALDDHSVEHCRKVIENTEAAVVAPSAENTATSTVPDSPKTLEPAIDEHSR